jgi:type II secretory pathway component PulJ
MSLKTHKDGYLMLEVIASIAVVAIGLAIILRSFSYSMRAAKISQEYFEAMSIAEKELCSMEIEENLKSGLQVSETSHKIEGKPYLLRSEVKHLGDENSNLNEVLVLISWENKERNENFEIDTYLSNR